MKKFLILSIMCTSLIFIKGVQIDNVEASVILVSDKTMECPTPRFSYLDDEFGDQVVLSCTISVNNSDLRIADYEDIEVEINQVDINGEFIKNIDVFNTRFRHGSSLMTQQSYTLTVDEYPYAFNIFDVIGSDKNIYSMNNLYNHTGGVGGTAFNFYSDELLADIDWDSIPTGGFETLSWNGSQIGDEITFDVTYRTYNNYTFNKSIRIDNFDFYDANNNIENDIVYYQFESEGVIMYSGSLALNPVLDINEYQEGFMVEVGRHYINGNPIDFSDADIDNYVYSQDEQLIIHFDIPIDGEEYTINFYDTNTGTIAYSFDREDILNYADGYWGNYNYIVVNVTGGYINALVVPNAFDPETSIPDIFRDFYLDEGVYFVTLEDISGEVKDYSTYPIIISNDIDKNPFSIDLTYDEINIDEVQRVGFLYNNDVAYKYFETFYALDSAVNENYNTYINDSGLLGTYIGYEVNQLLSNDDVVVVTWAVQPKSLPKGFNPSNFTIYIQESYTIKGVEEDNTLNGILGIASYWGFDNEISLSILSTIIMFTVNLLIILLMKVKGYIVYAIINSVMLLLLSFMNLLSVWFGLGIGVIIVLALVYNMNVFRSDEL